MGIDNRRKVQRGDRAKQRKSKGDGATKVSQVAKSI